LTQLTVSTIDQVIELIASGKQESIDLTGASFIDPYALVLLVLSLRQRENSGIPFHVRWPRRSDVQGWMRAMGFFEEINDPKLAARRKGSSKSNALQPITHILEEEGISLLVGMFEKRLRKRYPLTNQSRNSLVKLMFELFQNIPQHSNATGEITDSHGLAAMQDYADSIFLAVGDMGIGLRKSLATRPGFAKLSDASALNKIVYEGMSRFVDPGRGGELRQIARLIRKWDGLLVIRSEEALLHMDVERGEIYDVPYLPGVQIGLRIPRHVFGIGSPEVDNKGVL